MFHSYFSQSHTKGNINSSYKHIIYVLATLKSKKVQTWKKYQLIYAIGSVDASNYLNFLSTVNIQSL